MTKKEKNSLQALLIACHVRNTLEDLHAGKVPQSLIGDYTDVKVVTPNREIPWNELSRISGKEMHFLMLEIEKSIQKALLSNEILLKKYGEKEFYNLLKNGLYNGPSWNRKDYTNQRSQK